MHLRSASVVSGLLVLTVPGQARRPGESPQGETFYALGGDAMAALGFTLKSGRFLDRNDAYGFFETLGDLRIGKIRQTLQLHARKYPTHYVDGKTIIMTNQKINYLRHCFESGQLSRFIHDVRHHRRIPPFARRIDF